MKFPVFSQLAGNSETGRIWRDTGRCDHCRLRRLREARIPVFVYAPRIDNLLLLDFLVRELPRRDCLKPFAMLLTPGEFPLVSLWIEPGYGVIGRDLEMQMAAQEQR